ncbi:VOC family protein [Granulicella arctica]|uniref:VOC family protein n=1 Tax=Granulicella arctica TaxID=940613 RepID=UPI0021DF8105|nr:VOC family protein [Granulicella arctica]
MEKLPPLLPYLVVSNGTAAVEFYKKAFDAVEDEPAYYAPGTTKILNVRMSIRGGVFMLCDDFSKMAGIPESTPEALGGSPVTLHLHYETGIDEAFEKAVAAGASVKMPLIDQFWGDRYGQLMDPFGHRWAMGQTISKPSLAELDERADEAFKSMQSAD